MAEDPDKDAVDHLKRLVQADSGAPSTLESMNVADLTETIRPVGTVPSHLQDAVDGAVEKIARGRPLSSDEQFATEAIIIPDRRPAVDILASGDFHVDHPLWLDYGSGTLKQNIQAVSAAVGRIELPGLPSIPYGGTGFVVARDLLMTNRHVAELFSSGLGLRDLVFRPGQSAAIDFEKCVDGGSLRLGVRSIRMIHPYWDMALLDVEGLPEPIEPLKLSAAPLPTDPVRIAVIGYPAFDPRNDAAVQNQVFHGIYNVKRLMPGMLTGRRDIESFGHAVSASTHDSSTTGGASGSTVVDPVSRMVMALHFGGIYKDSNFGVPAMELARDGRVVDAGLTFVGEVDRGPCPWESAWQSTEAVAAVPRGPSTAPGSVSYAPASLVVPTTTRLTIPLTVTIDVAVSAGSPLMPVSTTATAGEGDVVPVETVAEDYSDRKGYQADFLATAVALPEVVRDAADVLTYANGDVRDHVLRYEHFSVVMSRSRRQCFFSAVNIDGGQSHKSTRAGWRRDSRIPQSAQILNECYGNPPKFSRGHMTRREDPVWGDPQSAERGNGDSMHVTNTVPQMQAFNSPIWLALEDYALQHARKDAMKISVFTGPYFDPADPTYYGVRVPVAFWKVIAFIHDDTGKLCATGYEMSQQSVLPADGREFVFGSFQSSQLNVAAQVPIRSIEQRAGLSLGPLAGCDPLGDGREAVADGGPLAMLEQIRFIA